MIFNMCIFPVRIQMTNTQNMNNSEMSTQNIPNLRVCSFNKRESKRINEDERKLHICSTDQIESKRVIFNACSSNKSKSKSVHKSINKREVKDVNNETKDKEPLVT